MHITPKFGCGTGIFFLAHEETHYLACQLHDLEYDQQRESCMSRWQVDRLFLQRMLGLAQENIRHRFRAYLYRLLVTLFGRPFWKRSSVYDPSYFAMYDELVAELAT